MDLLQMQNKYEVLKCNFYSHCFLSVVTALNDVGFDVENTCRNNCLWTAKNNRSQWI